MRNKILYKTVAIILLTNSVVSCMKDDVVLTDPQKYTRPLNIAGPIANIHFGAKDLLEKIDTTGFFQVDEEGLLHFRYDTAMSLVMNDLIQFDNLALEGNYDIGAKKKAAVLTFQDSIITNKDPNQRFDSTYIKESMLKISITAPPGFSGTYKIDFPEIFTPDGNPVSVTGDLTSNQEKDTDLANAKIFFQNKDNKSFCRIITTVTVESISGVPANTIFNIKMAFDPFKPQIIFGYFGQIDMFKEQQEMELSFFKSLNISNAIQFKDISLEVLVSNSFGAPLEVVFDSLLFSNETSGEEVNVKFNDGVNSMLISSAVYGNPIVPSVNSLLFNADNSNLIDGINLSPTKVYTSFTGTINPNGETGKNFMNTDLQVDANLVIDIPFWFKTESYERTDTMGFDFVNMLDSSQIDYLEELNLYFVFTNGFPFNIVAQAYFVDSSYQKVDSIFNDGSVLMWKSGIIDSNGKVSSSSITNVDMQILHDKAKNMYDKKTKYILFKSNVSTGDLANPEFVKLYDSYYIDAKLSGEVKSGEIKY